MQGRRLLDAAAELELRPNLHERCAPAGTEPAATRRSNTPAKPRATTKVFARACAFFRRRNGGQAKRNPPSERQRYEILGRRQWRSADSSEPLAV